MRADARRNYERVVEVAVELVAKHGESASLEEIARRAGVGSATLHRHFKNRYELLEAVFRERVDALCARGEALIEAESAADALQAWLRAVVRHAAANRGLGASLLDGTRDPELARDSHARIFQTGQRLLDRAQAERAVRANVRAADLFALVNGIALATEGERDGEERADRLLGLAFDGVTSDPGRA